MEFIRFCSGYNKCCLDKLPGYQRTQIGFLTFDSILHFLQFQVYLDTTSNDG
eukprot:c7894_g1_i1 orf=121-276(+)